MASISILTGSESFRELREGSHCYVDKTSFLEELLARHPAKVSLITRPRRFGKTLNMSMLEEFLAIDRDSRALFEGLAIAGNRDLCAAWMNRYPVISLSLQSMKGDTFEEALFQFSLLASRLCKACLLESPRIEKEEKELIATIKARTMKKGILADTLFTLCCALHAHHGRKPVLLVDEYDVPLAEAERNGYYREMAEFLQMLLGKALKGNRDLGFAVLTGCLRITKESIFTGLNNFKCYGISDVPFAGSFGFTEPEVEQLLAEAGLSPRMGEIKKWYDGYRFGIDQEIYCPWDVLQYVEDHLEEPDKAPQTYWRNTSSNDIVKAFLGGASWKTREMVEVLVNGGSVTVPVLESITYDGLYASEANVWTVLYLTGYLTRAPQGARTAGGQPQDCGSECLVIPNREVLEIYKSDILGWFRASVAGLDRRDFFTVFWKGDAAAVSTWATRILARSICVRDAQEKYYHGLMTGLFAGEPYEVLSEEESGDGFPDIIVVDTAENRAAVVEIRRAASHAALPGKAEEALRQIGEKRYDDRLQGVYSPVLRCGLAFCGKRCLALFDDRVLS